MTWDIDFISYEDFKKHVRETIILYKDTLRSYDLSRFNKNIVDPIKLIFDSKVYCKTIVQVISDEIVRQRDKTNNNIIGFFHQKLFKYIANCEVPEAGFDIIFFSEKGTIYVELKNKHNTMNSSSAQRTYLKMKTKLSQDDSCSCFLVEVIAKKSQNIAWHCSIDGYTHSNSRIRRVSIDKFYELVTGDKKAFQKICVALLFIIDEIISEDPSLTIEPDTVIDELRRINSRIELALYLTAFETYEGFDLFEKYYDRLIKTLTKY